MTEENDYPETDELHPDHIEFRVQSLVAAAILTNQPCRIEVPLNSGKSRKLVAYPDGTVWVPRVPATEWQRMRRSIVTYFSPWFWFWLGFTAFKLTETVGDIF